MGLKELNKILNHFYKALQNNLNSAPNPIGTTKRGAFRPRFFGPRYILKPRFLKTGLKEKRASCVLYVGPQPSSSSAFFTHLAAFFWGWTQAAFSTRSHRALFFLGWSYCTAFVFVSPPHVLNLSLKSPTPSLFSLTLDLSDLLPSLSPSIADLTVADPSPI